MGRGDAIVATAKGTPRVRNKITHKTRLRIIHGDIQEADRPFPEDDHTDGKALATGVDAEDANEYHLLAVLAASQQQQQQSASSATFCQQSPASSRKNALATPAPSQPAPHIPTPDATGKVTNYADFYPDVAWEPSTLLAKASDTVEESQADVLGGGYAYVLDERDEEWLERNNKTANGEGTSASAAAGTPRARSAKARGKEPEVVPTLAISEDDFELVMGLFERLTDDKFPYLHLEPTEVPQLSDYEPSFSVSIPPHYFPCYSVPDSIPPPAAILRYARVIYPHWRERKLERGGRRIIPQLNYDESNDQDPYVCFRRREVKPLRKTRRQDTTSLDRLLKLHDELHKVLDMTKVVLDRESLKADSIAEMKSVTEKRVRLLEVKRKLGTHGHTINDDELFVDRSAIRRKTMDGNATIRLRRRELPDQSQNYPQPGSQLTPAELHQNALGKLQEFQSRIDNHVAKKRDPNWEDITDNAYQPLSVPLQNRHFRSISLPDDSQPFPFTISSPTSTLFAPSLASSSSSPSPPPPSSRTGRTAGSMRMRIGRGGRMLVDRKMPLVRHPLDQPSITSGKFEVNSTRGYLKRPSLHTTAIVDAKLPSPTDQEKEKGWKLDERWRYDSDAGIPIGSTGLGELLDAEDTRLIIDDFEHNTFMVRKVLLPEEDFASVLRTDDGHIRRAEVAHDQRKDQEKKLAVDAHQRAMQLRHEIAARAPPAPPPPTPSTPQAPVSVAVPNGAQASNVNTAAAASAMNANPAILAQLKKVQMRQQQIQANQMQARPHPLTVNAAVAAVASAAQASQSPASAGTSPSLANGLPVANGVNGIVVPHTAINGKPTPPPSQTSFPNHLQSTAAMQVAQSPIIPDTNGTSHPLSAPHSPEAASRPQPQANTSSMGVPMSINGALNIPNAAYMQNGLVSSFGNGIGNGVTGLMPASPSMTMQMRANGVNGQVLPTGTGLVNGNLTGMTQQQLMGMKNAFAANQVANGMSPPQQVQQQPVYPNGVTLNGMPLNSVQNVQNFTLGMGNGNIPLKMPAQRMMQMNAVNGITSPQQRQQQPSSPIPPNPSLSPVNGQRLAVNGRGSPHLQPNGVAGRMSPANVNGLMAHHQANGMAVSPRATPQMQHAPSPLAAHQQTVGGPAQGHLNGF